MCVQEFNHLLHKTEPGNGGNIGKPTSVSAGYILAYEPGLAGIYFQEPEITPAGQGLFRWDSSGTSVSSFPSEVEVRAIVEGQFMAKRVHASRLGYKLTPSSRLLATGGASQNTAILQVWM